MGDRKNALAHQLAHEAARTDIESYCKVVVATETRGKGHWYDASRAVECCEVEHALYIPTAIEYLSLTGRIERHSIHPNWVRILTSGNEAGAASMELQ